MVQAHGTREQVLNSLVVCSVCQAGQGEPCTEDGRPRKKVHWDRHYTWQTSPSSVQYPHPVTSAEIDRTLTLRAVGDDES